MKTQLTFLLLFISSICSAQWSNTSDNHTLGKLGVGIATPAQQLHVKGKMFVDYSGGGFLGHFKSTGNGWSEIVVENQSGPSGNSTVYGHVKVEGGQVEIGSRSIHPVHIGAGDNKSHLNIMTNGNVGVGTTTPSARLEVNGMVKFDGPNSNDELISKSFAGYRSLEFHQLRFHEWGIGNVLNITNGKIGINTINPTEALTINGKILCEAVKVISNVPASDYVFEPDYDLMSIAEVEKFVTTNKHLPEVPSAKEFQENGYLVGDMDDLLLRKVEELTLYIIELKKEINELKTAE